MFCFFASESTIAKLLSHQRKVILLGSFAGCWNFGDVMQLKGAIQWHATHHPTEAICPIISLATIRTGGGIDRLTQGFGVQDWIFYEYFQDDNAAPTQLIIESHTLHKIEGSLVKSNDIVHVYGGGFLNRFWGHWQLRLIEDALRQFRPSLYVVSGQQVDSEFAPAVVEHIKVYKPLVIGCRDQDSVEALSVHNIKASYSGDDSWEVLAQCADKVGRRRRRWSRHRSFGMHLNLSWYTHQDNPESSHHSLEPGVLQELTDAFTALQERFGADTSPVVVCAYPDPRLELLDSFSSIEMTFFTMYFPRFIAIDLIGLLTSKRWSLLKLMLDNMKVFIASSYHTALFFKMLGVPTLLCAFNQYYQQKARALGQAPMSVREFLTQDMEEYKRRQDRYLKEHAELRRTWKALLEQAVTKPS